MGCVDFFGLATFLGNGQITAGTIFLISVVGITLLVGRVFCGWGCHFALFQDLLTKFFAKIGLRTPFRRSRLEFIVPPILFVITLLYPIVLWWRHAGFPREVTTNLAYPDVWHLLPGVKGVVLILLVDVVLLTALFGSRAFCRFVCPYGLFLKFFHVLSPLRVVKVGSCSDCGACTRACPTGVPIKYEAETFGVVRDLNCMNCGDCVSACPTGALALKPTKRAYSLGWMRGIAMASQPRWVEILLILTTIGGLAAYRGREYGDFLAAGMGLVVGAIVVMAVDPIRFCSPRLVARLTVTRLRVLAGALALYLAAGIVGQVLGLQALRHGQQSLKAGNYDAMSHTYSAGSQVARVFRPFTFYLDDFAERSHLRVAQLADLGDRLMTSGAWSEAEHVYRSIISLEPGRVEAHGNLGTALMKQGRLWEAAACYLAVLDHDPNDLVALYHLAMTRVQLGDLDDAVEIVQEILTIDKVGNAYELIRGNPLFQLLNQHPDYRRLMAVYRPQKSVASPKGEMTR